MSTSKPETLLVGKIMKYLDTVPRCCYEKRHGDMYGNAGQPDISACIDGRRVEIEVKVPSKLGIDTDYYVWEPLWPAVAVDIMNGTHGVPFPGNKPTAIQIERLLAWECAGAIAFIAHSVDAVRYEVEKMQRREIK